MRKGAFINMSYYYYIHLTSMLTSVFQARKAFLKEIRDPSPASMDFGIGLYH